MITRIKEIHWWDPKAKKDAVTYKVWVTEMGKERLEYFTSQAELSKFQKTFLPKTKKAKRD